MSVPSNTVLVTGGAGYIGSHACKTLAEEGYLPVTFDSLVTGHREAVQWGPFELGDIRDCGRLVEVMHAHQPAAIMHFAAFAYVGESSADPAKYYQNNVAGTLSLLEAARACDIGRFIFSSTCATYGQPQHVPIPETAAQLPINPYGRSKLMIEQILRDYGSAYGMNSIALRYFNAAGADVAGDIGEQHDPETHLVPLVLNAIRDAEAPITVFGTDYPTRDGTCVRDYTHVSDIAAAHVQALRLANTEARFRAYNLGTGTGYSVREIIATAEQVTGKRAAVRTGPRRSGDPAELVADASLARAELGWQARQSDLQSILASAWAWMQRS